ncbi:MAG: class I SAM-dependent methyltransferase [Acidimicrobiia bacterium]
MNGAPSVADEDLTCAACRSRGLTLMMDYGSLPLAGAFPSAPTGAGHERYPLSLRVCPACLLVQVPERVAPEVLFADYRYRSSVPLSDHFHSYAEHVPQVAGATAGDLIVEVGCNDGVLLNPLHAMGYTNLVGVDPAKNMIDLIPDTIPTRTAFFGETVAAEIVRDLGRASLVLANNVFAHVDDLHDFLDGTTTLLSADGLFVFEVHDVSVLLEGAQFDTVYHEHRYYYSLLSLRPLLASHGLRIVRVERLATHGGSLRVYCGRVGTSRGVDQDVDRFVDAEVRRGLADMATYTTFAQHAATARRDLEVLMGTVDPDSVVVGAGAAGRAVTLLNVVPDVAARLRCVVDESPERIGRYIAGVATPIVALDELRSARPDVVLVTAWPYADEFCAKIDALLGEARPQYVIPLPTPRFA